MTDPFSNLVLLADLNRWVEECARIDAEIAGLTAKREKFGRMIELAKEFVSDPIVAREEPALVGEPAEAAPAPVDAVEKTPGVRRSRKDAWKPAIELIVKAHPEGIAYDKIRELVPENLRKQLEQFPAAKGFYTALGKLHDMKVIVRENGVAFTRKGYASYKRKLAAGETPNITSGRRASAIEDAIKEFLRENSPAKGVAIRAHLIKFDEFGQTMLRNSSAMYNVLLRLKGHGEITHDEDTATYSIVQENGALDDDVESAPETGEVTASPVENRPGLRLIG